MALLRGRGRTRPRFSAAENLNDPLSDGPTSLSWSYALPMLAAFLSKAKRQLKAAVRRLGWPGGSEHSQLESLRPTYRLQWTNTEGVIRTAEVVLAGTSPRVIRVGCRVSLNPGVAVTVSGDASVRGVVTNCTRREDLFLVEIRCAVDRRKSRREVIHGSATLDWWSETGGTVHLPAEVGNVGEQGAQVQTTASPRRGDRPSVGQGTRMRGCRALLHHGGRQLRS